MKAPKILGRPGCAEAVDSFLFTGMQLSTESKKDHQMIAGRVSRKLGWGPGWGGLPLGLALPLLGALAGPARLPELGNPTGKVILTISGKIQKANAGKTVKIDLAMLDSLPQSKVVTKNPWTKGTHTYEGPLISTVMDWVGSKGTNLVVTALNDYVATIPTTDLIQWPVILSTRVDGHPMTIREKGPTFVAYPFDEHPRLLNEVYFCRSIWQVTSIEVH